MPLRDLAALRCWPPSSPTATATATRQRRGDQLDWPQVCFDTFTDHGANVSCDNGNSFVLRLGVKLGHETKWTAGNGRIRRSHVYGITNLCYDCLHGTSARLADICVVSTDLALGVGFSVGAR
ncbi:autotransporter outer membrane beta-barrel domain-containing protein [Cupriavidus sp. SW-Y-13]|uniref:autotransporter outer membrane beta-barrel domain-containing protein n=1 Tax=Cupriavidus sp. SW-Y-13 TaxID=2653854 RepID=UPI001365E763|nr:autotransporter outer membrane beta-barrel domain-containing protein [Cupriavidus sp. SW-Y-13]